MYKISKIDFTNNFPDKTEVMRSNSQSALWSGLKMAANLLTDENAKQKRNAIDNIISVHNKIGDKILYLFLVEKV